MKNKLILEFWRIHKFLEKRIFTQITGIWNKYVKNIAKIDLGLHYFVNLKNIKKLRQSLEIFPIKLRQKTLREKISDENKKFCRIYSKY